MTTRRTRLDQYVRQATTPTASQAKLLADTATRQAVFDAILSTEPTSGGEPAAAAPHHRPTRRRLLTAAAATVVAAATAIAITVATHRPAPGSAAATARPAPHSTPAPSGPLGAGGISTSCVETYGATTLAGRAFAFDGTVIAAAAPSTTSGEAPPDVAVTFHVNRWYRGGAAAEVTVAMFVAPGRATAEGTPIYRIGSRLLVSGEPRFGGAPLTDPIAWACGFTRWYTSADAQMWQDTFR